MRGTSSSDDELTGDFGNEPEAISISDLDLLCLLAGKLSPFNFGLLQQYLPEGDIWQPVNSMTSVHDALCPRSIEHRYFTRTLFR